MKALRKVKVPHLGPRGNKEMGVSDSQSSPVPGVCVTGKNRPVSLHPVVSKEAGCGRTEGGRTQKSPPQVWKFLKSTGGPFHWKSLGESDIHLSRMVAWKQGSACPPELLVGPFRVWPKLLW